MRESNEVGKAKGRILYVCAAAVGIAVLVALAYSVFFGIAPYRDAPDTVSDQEVRLEAPGKRPFVFAFAQGGGEGCVLALTGAGSFGTGSEEQDELGAVLWESADGGTSWSPRGFFPEGSPEAFDVKDGVIFPDGAFVVSESPAVVGTGRGDWEPHVCYVSADGRERLLEGVDELSDYAEAVNMLGAVSESTFVLSCDAFEEGSAREHGAEVYLYDVELDQPVARCVSPNLKSGFGLFAYDAASFCVYGEGVARFDAATGEELPLDPGFAAFCEGRVGGDMAATFFSAGPRVYCAAEEGLYCYDTEKGGDVELIEFESSFADAGMAPPMLGVEISDGSCLVSDGVYISRFCF